MAIWTPITDASKLPDLGTDESEHLDFKRQAWGKGESIELARDIVQFANHLGGSLIIGAVEDESGRLESFTLVPNAEDLASRIRQVCYERLSPRIEPSCVVLRTTSGEVLVVNISPSEGPVAIRVDKKWEFFRRYGKGKQPIDFEEVERMWTDGRRGKILLSRIPEEELRTVYLEAVDGGQAFANSPVSIRRDADHFEVKLARGECFNWPYESVNAVWRRVGGGWFVSLAVAFDFQQANGKFSARYVPSLR